MWGELTIPRDPGGDTARRAVMKLTVNGQERRFEGPLTVQGLLDALDVHAARTAVMLNDEIVKRQQRSERALADGDRVEIIAMVGGG
jgi:thiamine biosynthesis protein ThiS